MAGVMIEDVAMDDQGHYEVVAEGEYEYRRDGIAVPVMERWRLLRKGPGEFELHSAREIPALSVVISARALVRKGRLQRCLLRWVSAGNTSAGTQCVAASSYHAGLGDGDGDGVAASYRVRHPGVRTRTTGVAGALYFPLLRIFAGQLLGALSARKSGEARVLVPWIKDPSQTEKLFEPEFSRRRVRFLGAVDTGTAGGPQDCFEYSGGQYADAAVYQLTDGLLQEYRWHQAGSEWTVRLARLSGKWPGETLWPYPVTTAFATEPAGA